MRVVAVAEHGDIDHVRWCGILPNLAVDVLQVDPLVEPAADPVIVAVGNEAALSRPHFGDHERLYARQDSYGTPNVGLGSILSMVV